MRYPMPSSRTLQRRSRLARRLMALFEQLGVLEDRRALLPPILAGAARRTLCEIETALDASLELPTGTRRPADLFIGTLLGMQVFAEHKRLTDKAFLLKHGKTYPRASGQE